MDETSSAPRPAAATQLGTSRSKNELISFLKSLPGLLVLVFLFRASVVEAFKIPSSSMEPTLLVGDHILVNKLSFGLRLPFVSNSLFLWGQPERGDIVVFTLPEDPSTNLIKRVIGLPGDRIKVEGTNVYINGRLYSEDDRYARWLNGGSKNFDLQTVPEGRIFLMGDNRDFSRDARFWPDPFLEISRVKGRAFIIYWNKDDPFRRMFRIVR